MALVNIDEAFIVALLHDPISLYKRAQRANFTHHLFQDEDLQKIYKVVGDLVASGSEVTEETVSTTIVMDKSLDMAKKPVLRSLVSELYEQEVKSSEFSFNVLKKRAKSKMFSDALKSTMHEMLSQSVTDVDPFIQRMYDATRKLRSENEEIDVTLYNSFEQWERRKKERVESVAGNTNAIQMTGNLSTFAPYFQRGFEPATITTFGGNTGVGKSLMLINVAKEAISPRQKLVGLFLIFENKKIQTESRLDSVLLERDYSLLWTDEEIKDNRGDSFFAQMDDTWGRLYTVKRKIGGFTAEDIVHIFEDFFKQEGIEPQFLIIDSPDHMDPIEWSPKANERKANVYQDLKNICDEYQIPIITSLPMTASSAAKKKVKSEDSAGSYDIARIVDNQIFFVMNDEDDLLGRRTLEIVKSRDGKKNTEPMYFKLRDSLNLEPWDEAKVGYWGIKPIDMTPKMRDNDVTFDESEEE